MSSSHTKLRAALVLTCSIASFACSSSSSSSHHNSPGEAGTQPDAAQTNDAGQTNDGSPQPEATPPGDSGPVAACAPAIPKLTWKSPYAGFSHWPSGTSFFPIGAWLQIPQHAAELSQIGVNVIVGDNAGTDTLSASDLATLASHNVYAIVGQDSAGLPNINNSTIIGWWMSPDEPDNAQPNGSGGYGPPVAPSTIVAEYNSYKSKDSTRPMFLGLGQGVAYDNWEGRGSNAPPEKEYVPGSDIAAFDIYPYNNCGGDANEQATCGQFWLNSFGVDRLRQWSTHGQAVWTDIETTVIAANTTSGPTPVQTESEVWLSLIHGANGIIYFIDSWNPSFREDAIFENQAMVTAVTALDQQIKSLAPELNSATIPNLVSVKSSSSSTPVDVMVKAKGTTLYVFAATSKDGAATASFTIQGMTGNASADVVGENRQVAITAGKFSDAFAQNGVHIYRVDLSTVKCN